MAKPKCVDFGGRGRTGYRPYDDFMNYSANIDTENINRVCSHICGGFKSLRRTEERSTTNEMKLLVTRIGDDPIPSGSKPDVLPNSNSRVS